MSMPRMFSIENELEVIEAYKQGGTLYGLADEFGCSAWLINETLTRHSVEKRKSYGFGLRREIFFDQTFFDVIDTESKAYFLGFLFADGNVCSKINKTVLRLNVKDKNILNVFANEINFPLNRLRNVNVFDKRTNNTYHFGELSMSSKYMVQSLIKHGCTPRKSLTLKFPATIPNNLIHHFIRGYFDGDGCMFVNNRFARIEILSTFEFLESLSKIIIDNIKIEPSSITKRGKIFVLRYCRKGSIMKLFEWMYEDANFYLERKYNKFKLVEVN